MSIRSLVLPALMVTVLAVFAEGIEAQSVGGSGPSIDELLNLPAPAKPGAMPVPPAGDDDLTEQVRRSLTGEQAADAFKQAVDEMRIAADKLGQQRDAGLSTQRLQEQILAKLDQVIASARRQQSQSSSSSSSSSSNPQQQQQSNPSDGKPQNQSMRQNTAQRQDQAPGQQAQSAQGENRGEITDPGQPRQGESAGPVRNDAEGWGKLPPRVRDQLQQGLEERFSPVYQDLTEAYYRRLAEQAP